MAVYVFAAGTHRAAAPIPAATPPTINGAALAIVINRGDVRTRALLAELLDELEECVATDKRALHSLPATHEGEPS